MATRFPDSEPCLDLDQFTRTKLSIQTSFNFLIQKLAERRDQLLVQLHDLRVSYLSKEETRKKHIKDLDQLIGKLEEATIEQNLIVRKQEEQIEKWKMEKEEFQLPTPIAIPQLVASNLEELQHQIEMFGALQDIATLYRNKLPIRTIGKKGKGKVEFEFPLSVKLDGKGNVFIADTFNNRIQLVSLEGKFIREFGKGELGWPQSIALYKEWIFVTDYNLNKILKYKIQNYKLECKSELGLNRPCGITVDNNEVFVVDCRKNRIVVLSLDLKFIREIRNKKLIHPTYVKVNMNKVFVANDSKPNILVFSKLGDLLNSIISLRDGTGYIYLCFDKFNNIIISDSSGKTIQIFTTEGQLVHSIECDYKPAGIAVTQDNIIVSADYFDCKIHLY